MQSEKIDALAGALSKAQSEIKGAVRDSSNPFFKSQYADLASTWDACRVPLTKNGLCVIQTTDRDDHGTAVITTLAHSSGQWISGKLYLAPKAADPQSIMSSLTYARRGALAAIVGIAPIDDDGESAMGRSGPPPAGLGAQNAIKPTIKSPKPVQRQASAPPCDGEQPFYDPEGF